MTSRLAAPHAPRLPSRIGALARFALMWLVVGASLATPAAVSSQEPPDTLQLPDTLQGPDSLSALQVSSDTLSGDTIYYNLPTLGGAPPAGFATGLWEWDREGIMSSGANTLVELFAEVPGLIGLFGGDYGTPAAVSAFGLGGGGVRVFRDGFEVYGVEGGVPDLQHVGLGGIQRVRLDRSIGVMTVELWSHRYDDGRVFSVVEAGTGDLDTNMFRGVYADPTSLGGSIAGAMERIDTRGVDTEEGGNRTGTWARYQYHRGDRAGLAVDFRSMGSQTKVPDFAPSISRSDLALRARLRLLEGVVAEAYTGRSVLNADDAGVDYEVFGGTRRQHGVRLGVERGGAWGKAEWRHFRGDELPARHLDLSGGLTRSEWGGVSAGLRRGRWDGTTASSVSARGWVGPMLGVSLFGSYESGVFGSRDAALLDELTEPDPPAVPQYADPAPSAIFTDRTAVRLGGSISLFGATLSGAGLFLDVDQHLPLGLELDYLSAPEPGLDRSGFEGWASLPLPFTSARLEGSYQRWDQDGPYLPRRIYRGSIEFHRTYRETGNLELWWSVGVRGHDPMSVFVADDGSGAPGLQTVPFYQNWYGRIQVRVVTVRLFFGWENFTLRQNLQTYPGRLLPYARTFFGLRWDMWN